MADAYRFGIEEEYFLADATTFGSAPEAASERFHTAAKKALDATEHELLKGQVEVATEPGGDLDAACESLRGLRQGFAEIAAEQKLAVFAAGTHPLADERQQATTEKPRYDRLKAEFGIIASRSMVCAMHIHVEVPDPDQRVPTMNRLVPFLPLCLALSTSSTFFQGRPCGLHGFRLSAFSQWPRMGLPEIFASQGDHDRMIAIMTEAGMIEDSSFIWWLIRPSTKYPTIEMRICDSCTKVEDAVAIAALYRCLVRAAERLPGLNAGYGPIERAVVAENVWQAQRHGVNAVFIDGVEGGTVSVPDCLERVLAIVAEEAEAFGCAGWLDHARTIVRDGSSADRQIVVYEAAKAKGASDDEALRDVTRMLVETSAA